MSELGVIVLMCFCVALLIAFIRFLAWLTTLQERHGSLPRAGLHAIRSYATVSHYPDEAPVVMSRGEDEQPAIGASSLQTDARQTPDRPMMPKPTPDQLLTLYQLMRRHGIKRDDAGVAFRAAGLTLDNNAWSKAQPPAEAPSHVTPIAGRPTDADFPYEAPA